MVLGASVTLAAVLTRAGQTERAEKLLQGIAQGDEISPVRSRFNFHQTLGEPEQAANRLEKLVEIGSAGHNLENRSGLAPGPLLGRRRKENESAGIAAVEFVGSNRRQTGGYPG